MDFVQVGDIKLPAVLFVKGQYEAVPGWRPIDTGSFGTVEISQPTGPHLGTELTDMHPEAGTSEDALVAIKYLRYSQDAEKNKEMDRALAKEITLLKRSSEHPNILRVIGLWLNAKTQLGIVSQFADKGALSMYLETKPSFSVLTKILRDVAVGLEYLHKYPTDEKQVGIAHGDLHPANVLIMTEGEGIKAVLGDFGLCKIVDEHGMTSNSLRNTGVAGLAAYLGPELYGPGDLDDVVTEQEEQSPEYAGHRTIKGDIFAFGMLSFTTFGGDLGLGLCGRKGKVSPFSLAISIVKGRRPLKAHLELAKYHEADRAAIETYWPSIVDCWQHDAAKRPAIEQVRNKIPGATE